MILEMIYCLEFAWIICLFDQATYMHPVLVSATRVCPRSLAPVTVVDIYLAKIGMVVDSFVLNS